MQLIIQARLEGARTGATAAEATIVDVVERQDRSVADLGLTLAEGRALLAKVQSILVSQQTAGWMASQVACCRCGSVLAHHRTNEEAYCHVKRAKIVKARLGSAGKIGRHVTNHLVIGLQVIEVRNKYTPLRLDNRPR